MAQLDVYDDKVLVEVCRSGILKTVEFNAVKQGDIIVMPYTLKDIQEKGPVVAKNAHRCEDPDYNGYVFYDTLGKCYFPEDFGAKKIGPKPNLKEEVIGFFFTPNKGVNDGGTGVFMEMLMPIDPLEHTDRIAEIEDCISAYLDGVDHWTPVGLAEDVCKSFDEHSRPVCPYSSTYVAHAYYI
jgi:hypothetical protein